MLFPLLLINIVISPKIFCQYSNTLLKGFAVLYSKITLKPRFSHVWISRITLIFRFIIKQYIRLSYFLFDARRNALPIKLACIYLCYINQPSFNFFFPELKNRDGKIFWFCSICFSSLYSEMGMGLVLSHSALSVCIYII